MTTTETKFTKDGLELQTCGRCGGSGKYSYCTMYGDRCFGCGGTGVKLTKRGQIAKAWLEAIRSKRVEDLQIGDEILIDDHFSGKAAFCKITAISPDSDQRSTTNGVETVISGLVKLEFDAAAPCGGYGGLRGSDLKRVRQTAASLEITRLRGMAFQDTLTKTGTPRKVKKA